MRAIIIEEERFAEILEFMKLKAMEVGTEARTADRLGWDKQLWKTAVDEVHRSMHFYFCRWMQEQGARGVR